MLSPAHTQILLFQYFKNDTKDPLAFESKKNQTKEQASNQLNRMVLALNTLGFTPAAKLLDYSDGPRNYSYPQFELHKAANVGLASPISIALQKALAENEDFRRGEFKFATALQPWVSNACLVTVRRDQRANHLKFNQFLAFVVELPFEGLADLRVFLEKDNYEVLKSQFLKREFWGLKDDDLEISSMPTYVLVGNKHENPAVGHWVMDIPSLIYNPHAPNLVNRSFVERGYPFVNYIVHERLENFVEYEYEWVDLGLIVFLHSHLDRVTKGELQEQAEQLKGLMRKLEASAGGSLSESLEEFRKATMRVAEITNALPEIEMMGRRLIQKYPSPEPPTPSIFQMVDNDNKEFLESSVRSVMQGIKVLQDLFLAFFEKSSEEHRGRLELFLKIISSFGVVMILKEIWRREDATEVFRYLSLPVQRITGCRWLSDVLSLHSNYFYSVWLLFIGSGTVVCAFLFFRERKQKGGLGRDILLTLAAVVIFVVLAFLIGSSLPYEPSPSIIQD